MSRIRVAASSRAFARGNILFGIIAYGIVDRDGVLLSSKTIEDFRLLSKDSKCVAALVSSLPSHILSFRAADQASLHAAFCVALQVTGFIIAQRSLAVCDTFLQRDIDSLHDPASLCDPSCLSALDAVIQARLANAVACNTSILSLNALAVFNRGIGEL